VTACRFRFRPVDVPLFVWFANYLILFGLPVSLQFTGRVTLRLELSVMSPRLTGSGRTGAGAGGPSDTVWAFARRRARPVGNICSGLTMGLTGSVVLWVTAVADCDGALPRWQSRVVGAPYGMREMWPGTWHVHVNTRIVRGLNNIIRIWNNFMLPRLTMVLFKTPDCERTRIECSVDAHRKC
jgi:hypothetical protein